MEEWWTIEWYEWRYFVSTKWRVKSVSLKTWKEKIKRATYRRWYLRVTLSKNWNDKKFQVHRLVAHAFLWLDLYEEKTTHHWTCVCHKNDIRDDNRLENLFIWTQRDNVIDAYDKWKLDLKLLIMLIIRKVRRLI